MNGTINSQTDWDCGAPEDRAAQGDPQQEQLDADPPEDPGILQEPERERRGAVATA